MVGFIVSVFWGGSFLVYGSAYEFFQVFLLCEILAMS